MAGSAQRRFILQDHAEFAERLGIVALHQIKVGRFPSYVWSGGIGLNGVFQGQGLI